MCSSDLVNIKSRVYLLTRAMVIITLNSTQYFSLLNSRNPDVGVGLACFPLYIIACIPTRTVSSQKGLWSTVLMCSAMGVVSLLYTALYFHSDAEPPQSETWYSVRAALTVVNSAAASGLFWPSTSVAIVSISRGVIFTILATFPSAWCGLMFGEVPPLLLGIYTAVFVMAVHIGT